MKIVITALAAAALSLGVSTAQAQTMSAEPTVRSDSSMSVQHKRIVRHRTYHRHTTGIGSENNASARGSSLPGKDRLNSKGYIQDH